MRKIKALLQRIVPSLGLMGVGDDYTLYTPSGRRLGRAPALVACFVQRAQHRVAVLSWRLHGFRG